MTSKLKTAHVEERVETDPAILEFLAKGGVIQQIERNVSGRVEGSSYSSWSKKPSTSPLANPPEED